jgi:hypothetical protein
VLTPKQAAFVREYLIDRNATQAAIRAGYSADTAKQQGSRLLTNVDVQAAVERQEERLQIMADVTVESIAKQLDEDRALARQLGQPSAAVTATMGKAKLYGLLVDKVESETVNTTYVISDSPEEMKPDEWLAKYKPSGSPKPDPRQH